MLITVSDGRIVGVQPKTGERVWEVGLPVPEGYESWLTGTPVAFHNKLAVTYQVRVPASSERVGHWVVIIDLEQRRLDPGFPPLELHAHRPTGDGTGVVEFDPATSLSRSALVHGPGVGDHPGYVYVSFGNLADI